MSDIVLLDGDQVIFMPNFGAAVVAVQPGRLQGSGPATCKNKNICVSGDESRVSVPGCTYFTPVYSIPGTGTLKIQSLAGNQLAKKSQTGGKKMMLKGGQFTAKFEVQNPAKMPPPGPGSPIPDPTPTYQGQGSFQPTNQHFKGS